MPSHDISLKVLVSHRRLIQHIPDHCSYPVKRKSCILKICSYDTHASYLKRRVRRNDVPAIYCGDFSRCSCFQRMESPYGMSNSTPPSAWPVLEISARGEWCCPQDRPDRLPSRGQQCMIEVAQWCFNHLFLHAADRKKKNICSLRRVTWPKKSQQPLLQAEG